MLAQQPAEELDELAAYYGTHDTSEEMEYGQWVEPQPMATTSLRLPVHVITELKREAKDRGIRYSTHVRDILEHAIHEEPAADPAEINRRLERIEHAVLTEEVTRPSPPA
jgi:predicted DNA-binding protein